MSNIFKENIAAVRGLELDELMACDGCGKLFRVGEMEPEEAGMWVCADCWKKWDSPDD